MKEELEARVERLERENRRIRRGAFIALVVIAGLIFMGQTSEPGISNVLRTRRLVIEDESGTMRLGLGVTSGGSGLLMFDETGKRRLSLLLVNGTPQMMMCDKGGTSRALLSADSAGPGLILCDEAGEARGAFVLPKSTGPGLALRDQKGGMRVYLGLDPKDQPTLLALSAEGNIIWKEPE